MTTMMMMEIGGSSRHASEGDVLPKMESQDVDKRKDVDEMNKGVLKHYAKSFPPQVSSRGAREFVVVLLKALSCGFPSQVSSRGPRLFVVVVK